MTKPTRLLMVAERFPPDIGGVATSAERTVVQLSRLGVQCDVFSWTKRLQPGRLETLGHTDEDIDVHRFGLFANLDLSMQHTWNVIEWLNERQPYHLIWGHYLYPSGFAAVLLARTLGIPSCVSARGNDIDRLLFPPGDFARLEWTLKKADVVTAVSADLASKIQGVNESIQPHVIHNTVNAEVFRPSPRDASLRDELGIRPNEAVVGFCGELRHKKGLPFLLSAMQEVRANRPACLLVIGEVRERDKRAIHDALADDADTRKRMIITGHLESPSNVARHLRLCDVVLCPSVWDGLPNALLEAMACGCVVLASDAGGIPEIIQHGENGFLVPRAHLHRLGDAMLECLDLPAGQRERIGEAARAHVTQHFHPSQEAEQLRQLLKDVLSPP